TLAPALPAVRPGILRRLPLDLLGVGLFEENRQFRAELGEMIEQLCIRKMIRRRNVRVLIDCGDPGLENLLPTSKHKISKPSDCWDRRLCLAVTSDERSPPNLISELNTRVALGKRIIPTKFANRNTGSCVLCLAVTGASLMIPGRSPNEDRKILKG